MSYKKIIIFNYSLLYIRYICIKMKKRVFLDNGNFHFSLRDCFGNGHFRGYTANGGRSRGGHRKNGKTVLYTYKNT